MDKEFLDNKTETSNCTLEEYKYVYPRLMNKHITTGVPGRNELQFIKREIENHTIILEGLKKTMKKISDFDYRRKNFDPIEENFGQEKFLNTMAFYGNMRDNHELIIEYLETKKTALQRGLIKIAPTVPAPENEQDKMYFKVGLLFAEKKIFSKIVVIDNYKTTKYYYKDEVFANPTQLSKHLNLTRQFINDSFSNADTNHNIFKNIKQLKNIVDYCNKNTITIDTEFLNKYSALIENRQ